MPCSRIQRRRARATSARFCSAACRVFFKAYIVSIKETLESAPTAGDALLGHCDERLLDGQIRLFGNQSQDPVRVLLQWRNTAAALLWRRASCLAPALAPSNYRTNTHLEDLGRFPTRRSALNRFNRTLTQVRGIRLGHGSSSPANQFLERLVNKLDTFTDEQRVSTPLQVTLGSGFGRFGRVSREGLALDERGTVSHAPRHSSNRLLT